METRNVPALASGRLAWSVNVLVRRDEMASMTPPRAYRADGPALRIGAESPATEAPSSASIPTKAVPAARLPKAPLAAPPSRVFRSPNQPARRPTGNPVVPPGERRARGRRLPEHALCREGGNGQAILVGKGQVQGPVGEREMARPFRRPCRKAQPPLTESGTVAHPERAAREARSRRPRSRAP